ncbi:UPF0505 protein C16orf62 [Liparis tanakae]|uniref:VPS35 endosomal protein-sorting factor-like n=1 Tax=Liparis tanakae TaxID=230148 RepID=A0A4Z2F898_9TELE|nr:UPF0505 protein C16orf62 [Liparis tanakae]
MRLLQRNNERAPPPHSGIPETLPRLTAMIRGIGDPLVAAYARAYLCRPLLTEMTDRCKKLGNK